MGKRNLCAIFYIINTSIYYLCLVREMEMKQGKPKCETHKPNGWEKAMGRAK